MTTPAWLGRILDPRTPPFALLHRPVAAGAHRVDLIFGETGEVDRVADIPVPAEGGQNRHEVLALLPFRQIAERGFVAPEDDAGLLTMAVTDQAVLPLSEVLDQLPDGPIELTEGGFDLADEEYAELVRRVVTEEIGQGAGANFVLKRSFSAEITNWSARTALSFFRRLLGRASGAYWTFVIHTGTRTFVGASPERHVSLTGGTAVMNPISGTYRYPAGGPELGGLLEFLADTKEAGELYMVLDEELKMMGRVCDLGARATGPYLKQLARIAHTEYLIEGHSSLDARDILRETMFAPTVTGGPLESACRVISRFEPEGRQYYAGVVALFGRDESGRQALDSAILIRTADVDATGRMRIPVGATLVRDSDPPSEAAETRAKAAGLLEALRGDGAGAPAPVPDLGAHPDVRGALAERNVPLADFWLADPRQRARQRSALAGRSVLVIDNEDMFTSMIKHVLVALGGEVVVRRFDEDFALTGYDLVIVGPGPGDPSAHSDVKISRIRSRVRELLANGTPFLAVCLGHQVLSALLGLELVRKPVPNQGVQRKVDLFGQAELVGFYNTFTAVSATDRIPCAGRAGVVEIFSQESSGEVHALRGPGFVSVQFHPESVLTRNGVEVLGEVLGGLLDVKGALAA
ncbi:anthranilate synthase family protein [Amycolatopsis cihanbeyliensis]|uniref:anthranilate synthase n=1 Tax=Amycolatopsis cihanbeyliensis TaxID=1128664 RepID=A0A542DPV5_AMYCI|nr:anthranilate synthase family protein [Amycolatopsis cihanbeyliensis]TQJ05133.1 phenazine biosynthesis protein phzE [Amycolatopsis cihanbeyliensis]